MLVLLEAGIDSDNWDIASELTVPCFEASAQHMEISESNFCLQLHFEYNGSAPLVQQNLPAKSDLENVYSAVVVFSSDTSTYRFTGKPVSQTTGLYYDYQRWYDPTIGRFISQDPVAGHLSDPQSLNRYSYVQNSPITYSDPSGQCPWCIAALIGAGIGAAVGYGWCVAETGGWTSSACGKQALEGAIVGGVIGLTLGLAAPEEGPLQQGADQLVNTADFWANTESTTTTIATDTTTSISASTTPVITSTSSEGSTSVITATTGERTALENVLPEDAYVVRVGMNEPQTLQTALEKGGIPANSWPGMTVEELSRDLPHPQIGVTTVGEIRGIGGDVVSDPLANNPFHATIVPGSGGVQELSEIFHIRSNPWVPR